MRVGLLRGLKELRDIKCLEQALAHTKWSVSVGIVFSSIFKGFCGITSGVENQELPPRRSTWKSCLGQMNSITGEELEAEGTARTK